MIWHILRLGRTPRNVYLRRVLLTLRLPVWTFLCQRSRKSGDGTLLGGRHFLHGSKGKFLKRRQRHINMIPRLLILRARGRAVKSYDFKEPPCHASRQRACRLSFQPFQPSSAVGKRLQRVYLLKGRTIGYRDQTTTAYRTGGEREERLEPACCRGVRCWLARD